jgi:hypothetical protein
VNAMAGRAIAAVGVVLAIVAIWIDAIQGSNYWSDGTTGVFLLVLAAIAGLGLAVGYAGGRSTNGWVFAAGAVLLGFYGWLPVALAFDKWDLLDSGAWLGVAGGALIVIGAGSAYLAAGGAASTPAGLSPPALAAGLGIALVFPGIFIDSLAGTSYWNPGFGRSLGIVLLVLAVACGLLWAAAVTGTPTRGLDQALSLVLLGLLAVYPVGAAFGDFGSLDSGAWLAFAGGILAAGGTWAARGGEMPRTAAAPA